MLKSYEPSGAILFEEEQKYPQWVMWIIRISFFVAIGGTLVAALLEKDKAESWIGLFIVVVVCFFVFYLIRQAKFEKLVTTSGLHYRERPWQKRYRVIEKEAIESVDARKFPFPSYGFGWFPGYGWYHNMGGSGVQLYLKNGRRFFFSSREDHLFLKALQHLISANQKSSVSEF